jgi:ABC-type multidrug transport system permease subunit
METPGDRELRRRKREADRGQLRMIRRIYIALFGVSCGIVLLTYEELAWLALVVLLATVVVCGWMSLKDK